MNEEDAWVFPLNNSFLPSLPPPTNPHLVGKWEYSRILHEREAMEDENAFQEWFSSSSEEEDVPPLEDDVVVPTVEDAPPVDGEVLCEACGDWNSPESMLLCDRCDGGYHMRCLEPVLGEIPQGEWFCPVCQPPVKPERRKPKRPWGGRKPKANRVTFVDDRPCVVCGEADEEELVMLLCDACNVPYHLGCLRPALETVPTGSWFCPDCEVPDDAEIDPTTKNPRRVCGKHLIALLAKMAPATSGLAPQAASALEAKPSKRVKLLRKSRAMPNLDDEWVANNISEDEGNESVRRRSSRQPKSKHKSTKRVDSDDEYALLKKESDYLYFRTSRAKDVIAARESENSRFRSISGLGRPRKYPLGEAPWDICKRLQRRQGLGPGRPRLTPHEEFLTLQRKRAQKRQYRLECLTNIENGGLGPMRKKTTRAKGKKPVNRGLAAMAALIGDGPPASPPAVTTAVVRVPSTMALPRSAAAASSTVVTAVRSSAAVAPRVDPENRRITPTALPTREERIGAAMRAAGMSYPSFPRPVSIHNQGMRILPSSTSNVSRVLPSSSSAAAVAAATLAPPAPKMFQSKNKYQPSVLPAHMRPPSSPVRRANDIRGPRISVGSVVLPRPPPVEQSRGALSTAGGDPSAAGNIVVVLLRPPPINQSRGLSSAGNLVVIPRPPPSAPQSSSQQSRGSSSAGSMVVTPRPPPTSQLSSQQSRGPIPAGGMVVMPHPPPTSQSSSQQSRGPSSAGGMVVMSRPPLAPQLSSQQSRGVNAVGGMVVLPRPPQATQLSSQQSRGVNVVGGMVVLPRPPQATQFSSQQYRPPAPQPSSQQYRPPVPQSSSQQYRPPVPKLSSQSSSQQLLQPVVKPLSQPSSQQLSQPSLKPLSQPSLQLTSQPWQAIPLLPPPPPPPSSTTESIALRRAKDIARVKAAAAAAAAATQE